MAYVDPHNVVIPLNRALNLSHDGMHVRTNYDVFFTKAKIDQVSINTHFIQYFERNKTLDNDKYPLLSQIEDKSRLVRQT